MIALIGYLPHLKISTFKIGENLMVNYKATNISNYVSSGTATFNVLPEKVGPYFIKTECFCFQNRA